MTPLIAITIVVILVCVPASVGATWFMWHLYDEDRDTATDPSRITLSGVLAGAVTLATVAGVALAIPTLFYLIGIDGAARRLAGQLVLVAIDILLPLPVLIALYLRWLRRGRR